MCSFRNVFHVAQSVLRRLRRRFARVPFVAEVELVQEIDVFCVVGFFFGTVRLSADTRGGSSQGAESELSRVLS